MYKRKQLVRILASLGPQTRLSEATQIRKIVTLGKKLKTIKSGVFFTQTIHVQNMLSITRLLLIIKHSIIAAV